MPPLETYRFAPTVLNATGRIFACSAASVAYRWVGDPALVARLVDTQFAVWELPAYVLPAGVDTDLTLEWRDTFSGDSGRLNFPLKVNRGPLHAVIEGGQLRSAQPPNRCVPWAMAGLP